MTECTSSRVNERHVAMTSMLWDLKTLSQTIRWKNSTNYTTIQETVWITPYSIKQPNQNHTKNNDVNSPHNSIIIIFWISLQHHPCIPSRRYHISTIIIHVLAKVCCRQNTRQYSKQTFTHRHKQINHKNNKSLVNYKGETVFLARGVSCAVVCTGHIIIEPQFCTSNTEENTFNNPTHKQTHSLMLT